MEQEHDTRMSLVVIEAGAGWPHWITEYQRRAPNASVIAQTSNEAPEQFGVRVLRRVEEIVRGPGRFGVAILLCTETAGPEQQTVRAHLAREMVQALHGTGDLVLAALEGSDAFQQELFVLAGNLCEDESVSRVNVRVRFGGRQSGTMPSVLPAARLPSDTLPDDDQERVSWTGSG
jgi:hypothetical protein